MSEHRDPEHLIIGSKPSCSFVLVGDILSSKGVNKLSFGLEKNNPSSKTVHYTNIIEKIIQDTLKPLPYIQDMQKSERSMENHLATRGVREVLSRLKVWWRRKRCTSKTEKMAAELHLCLLSIGISPWRQMAAILEVRDEPVVCSPLWHQLLHIWGGDILPLISLQQIMEMIIQTSFASLLLSFERGSLSKSPEQVFLSGWDRKERRWCIVRCGFRGGSFGAGKGRGMAETQEGPLPMQVKLRFAENRDCFQNTD